MRQRLITYRRCQHPVINLCLLAASSAYRFHETQVSSNIPRESLMITIVRAIIALCMGAANREAEKIVRPWRKCASHLVGIDTACAHDISQPITEHTTLSCTAAADGTSTDVSRHVTVHQRFSTTVQIRAVHQLVVPRQSAITIQPLLTYCTPLDHVPLRFDGKV